MNAIWSNAGQSSIVDQATGELASTGFAILRSVVDPSLIQALSRELDERFERTDCCDGLFFGKQTKRLHGLLKRTTLSSNLVLEPQILEIAEAMLLPYCDAIQLNLTQAIEIYPGEPAQAPHRDQDMWQRPVAGTEYLVNVMWPMTPFTRENGATRLWAGTHEDLSIRRPALDHAVIAEMLPGDALIYLGSVIHGAGANGSNAPRRGLVISYSLGWLKPFENMSLTYPPSVAKQFSKPLADLVGYRCHVGSLGNHDGNCPSLLLKDEADEFRGASEVMSAEHQRVLGHFASAQNWPESAKPQEVAR
jgi:ectoine hydroxylase-related dioxygenase (phytanoyl-CoA dioxygenase family)